MIYNLYFNANENTHRLVFDILLGTNLSDQIKKIFDAVLT